MKFGDCFSNLLLTKVAIFLDLFSFGIFIVRCLAGYLFSGHSVDSSALCSLVAGCC